MRSYFQKYGWPQIVCVWAKSNLFMNDDFVETITVSAKLPFYTHINSNVCMLICEYTPHIHTQTHTHITIFFKITACCRGQERVMIKVLCISYFLPLVLLEMVNRFISITIQLAITVLRLYLGTWLLRYLDSKWKWDNHVMPGIKNPYYNSIFLHMPLCVCVRTWTCTTHMWVC